MGAALFYPVSPLRSAQFAGWARDGRLFRDSLRGGKNINNTIRHDKYSNKFKGSRVYIASPLTVNAK